MKTPASPCPKCIEKASIAGIKEDISGKAIYCEHNQAGSVFLIREGIGIWTSYAPVTQELFRAIILLLVSTSRVIFDIEKPDNKPIH